jgi:SAM-dependent methyltransferase
VLDLGCGPGFYSHRLAARGCECVGIDFSPASIRYAQQEAERHKGLACSYRLGDLRHEPFGEGFDLVMLVYGQFNVFPRSQAREILKNASAALESEGALLLEIQSSEQVRAAGEQGPGWYTSASGLFSHRPHLVLQENFWNPEAQASTIRFIHIDAQSGKVESHVLSNEAYSEAELDEALKAAGFHEIRRFPSLSGTGTEASTDLPVVVASRCSVGAESRFPVG